MLDLISKKLNFSYKIVTPNDNKYGALNAETKEWDGMMKMMVNDVLMFFFLIFKLLFWLFTFQKVPSHLLRHDLNPKVSILIKYMPIKPKFLKFAYKNIATQKGSMLSHNKSF
jgi:hypothetical protein